MRDVIPTKTIRNNNIAADRIVGATYRELMQKYNLSVGGIQHILNSDQIRDVIETGTAQAVSLVPKAIDNYNEFLSDEDKKIRLSATQDIMTITGIRPSHTQSFIISNSFNQHNQTISPEVLSLLSSRQEDIIDIELDIPGEGEDDVSPCDNEE